MEVSTKPCENRLESRRAIKNGRLLGLSAVSLCPVCPFTLRPHSVLLGLWTLGVWWQEDCQPHIFLGRNEQECFLAAQSVAQHRHDWTEVKTPLGERGSWWGARTGQWSATLPGLAEQEQQVFPALRGVGGAVPWSALGQPPVLLRVARSCPFSWQHRGGAHLGAGLP